VEIFFFKRNVAPEESSREKGEGFNCYILEEISRSPKWQLGASLLTFTE
jgi:hypothetical protein